MKIDWSLVFSIIGVVLGLISAYGRLKRFWLWLKRSGSEQIEEYRKHREKQVSDLAHNASHLIAYGLRRILWIIALTYLANTIEVPSGSGDLWIELTVYIENGLYVIIGALLGNILGDLKHIESASKKN
jgi:hypothetical protein